MPGLLLKAISSSAAGQATEAQKGMKNLSNEITFSYFGLMGRGDPLRQMFEYQGQPYKKVDVDPAEWEAAKARGEGGEFGGGLPQATFTDETGKEHRLA